MKGKKDKKDKDFHLQAITMIDPATSWIEIRSVPEARADLVANQVELACMLNRIHVLFCIHWKSQSIKFNTLYQFLR